jgi:dTDP-4-amino-4,6-dideoxygalactose transaminase
MKPPILEAVHRVFASGQYILGQEVEAFEHEVAARVGVKHAVGVGSGTDALLFALEALLIGSRDEVITSAFTVADTALPILRVGASPVFCDIDPHTFNLDPGELESLITSQTRAIIPVHLFGLVADMEAINEIASRREIPVIEDSCQAFGAEIDTRAAGSWGTAGVFSFYPTKPLGGIGDGGMLVTNDDVIASQVRALRNLGRHPELNHKYDHRSVGHNSRLDEIQAAVLRVKLQYLMDTQTERLTVADHYNEVLKDRAEITLPSPGALRQHVFHQYTIRLPGERRDDVYRKMRERGIGVSIYYPKALPRLRPFLSRNDTGVEAWKASSEVLSLPIWPGMTEGETGMVTDELLDVLAGK